MQFRLCAWLSLAILMVAVAAGIFSFVSALDEAHELQDDTLRQVAVLFDRQQISLKPGQNIDVPGDDEESRVIVQYLADGATVPGQETDALPLALPASLAEGLSTVSLGGEPFRVLVRTTANGARIAVAQETDARDKEARESALKSLLPFLVLIPVLLLVVTDLVRKLFRPIAILAADVDQRSDQALHPLDPQGLPSEVRPFVVAINRLLARVGQAMHTQGRFVADAAHELRSPLTALSLQAERLASADMSTDARERLAVLGGGIDRSRNLIEQLLSLTRAQWVGDPADHAVSVHATFRRVLEDVVPLADAKQIDIGVEGVEDMQVRVPEIDLIALVRNLVDNAIRYTPHGGRVDMRVALDQAMACIQVVDSGPGIAAHERVRVFDPFYRTVGNDEVGSGLGLAIVQAIAQRAGGTVGLAASDLQLESGLCVSVWLPLYSCR